MTKFKLVLNKEGESFKFKTAQQVEKFRHLIDPYDRIERIDIGLLTMTKTRPESGKMTLTIGGERFVTTPEWCFALYEYLWNNCGDINKNLEQGSDHSYWWSFGDGSTKDNISKVYKMVTFYPNTEGVEYPPSICIHFHTTKNLTHTSPIPTIEISSIIKHPGNEKLQYTVEKIDDKSEIRLVTIEDDNNFSKILVSTDKVELLDKQYISEYGTFR